MQNLVTRCLFHLWSMDALDSSLRGCCFVCISVLWADRQVRCGRTGGHALVRAGLAGVYHRAPTLDLSLRLHQDWLLADPSHASCPAWQTDGPHPAPQMATWLSGVWAVRGNDECGSKAPEAKPACCCLGASLEDAISRELPKLCSARGLSHC